ncbi:hypothetical protein QCA50_005349 [Cerrena zonata]|uniref:Bromo domain-containing protein n=1 Tax=Cerrena zonata TaxID=2478898 RepID=A0AAW0GQV9_9APHY
MNNLLRTLTDLNGKSGSPEPDLRLLLTTVKEARRQCLESKAADAFYDSLEGLLHDVRTVTIDNHDAEPFLKPVAKTDVPDYYEVITTPMDLQTMLKKVKQKSYKSKREFKDDLDLIWSNCFTYNAADNHPLRQCATRLKAKADKLLEYITDRKDRLDPAIPGEITPSRGVTPKVNGISLNGLGRARPISSTRSPSPVKALMGGGDKSRRDVPFPEEFAIYRTPEGMATFHDLDKELDARLAELEAGDFNLASSSRFEERLKEHAILSDSDLESLRTLDGELGEKRKLNGHDHRPRKRARIDVPEQLDPMDLWWQSMRTDSMIGNGLPPIRYASSYDLPDEHKPLSSLSTKARSISSSSPRKKKRKTKSTASKQSMLFHMNNNIRTLRKIRTTHAKYTWLKETTDSADGSTSFEMPTIPPEEPEEPLDEQPWKPQGSGIDIGVEHADDCLHWMGTKVLEHAGFQASSKAALDVLAGVASDYLLNVGRTISFLSEKYAKKMTPEEIILHTLFESGTTHVSELERYVRDDVVRYGSRLADLDKKLSTAYSEATSAEAWDDDALFKDEEEEEEGEFVMGNFADSFGEDFLGLRALGIADEFGLSSLTVPKKLLRGKNKPQAGPAAVKPTEPPPPFPPPPPFVPLNSKNVDSQIGLLKPYYQQRISAIASTSAPAPPIPEMSINGYPTPYPPMPPASPPPVVLADDSPQTIQTKMGPLGQITKPSASANAKKKSKPKGPSGSLNMMDAQSDVFMTGPETPSNSLYFASPTATPTKKGKGNNTGQTAKKKPGGMGPLPPVVSASA